MSTGVIYILTNPSFPDYVKIGYADDINKRLAQLNRSECVPFAFRVYATYEVQSRLSDIKIHEIIDKLNPNLRAVENFEGKKRVREFYAMTAEDAYTLLEAIAEIHGFTDKLVKKAPSQNELKSESEAKEIEKEMQKRRSPFNFFECGIKAGEFISYIHDKSIKCKVLDERNIEYNGETTSMTAVAKKLLNTNKPIQGTLYFEYNGEPLTELRDRIKK